MQNKAYNVQTLRVPRNVFGFPDRMISYVRYADIVSTTSTVGSLAKYVFRWNSTFDPDQTSTGHQPLYRDVYAGIYDHYAVISARCRFEAVNPNTTDSVVCGIITDDDTSQSSSFQTLLEQSHGISELLTPLSGSKSRHMFTDTWDAARILGVDPYTSEEYKTAVGSNPTEESTLTAWSIPQNGTSSLSVQWRIEIVYHVLWTELQTPSQN